MCTAKQVLNPNSIGVKLVLSIGGRGRLYHISVLTSILVKKYFFSSNFELNLQAFVITKAVSNREIYFIKAVLLLCEHRHFLRRIAYLPPPPPNTFRVKFLDAAVCLYCKYHTPTVACYGQIHTSQKVFLSKLFLNVFSP